MSILKVARLGNPVLRKKAAPVAPREIGTPEFQQLIDDLIATMREYDGVGLAAPQVHVSRQVVVFEVADATRGKIPLTVLINPQVAAVSRELEEDWEGCLSVPDLRGRVPRHREVEVRGLDRKGKEIVIPARQFAARVIQHETDHLQGILFVDRMRTLASLTFLDEYGRYWAKGGA
jgi:peptide deformylase